MNIIESNSPNQIINQKQNRKKCSFSLNRNIRSFDFQVDFLNRSILEVNSQSINLLTLNYCVNFLSTDPKSSLITKELKDLSKQGKLDYESHPFFRLENQRDFILYTHCFLNETDKLIVTQFWNMMLSIPERDLFLQLGEKVLFKLSIQIKYASSVCFSLIKKGCKYDLIENKVAKIQEITKMIFILVTKIFHKIRREKFKFSSKKLILFYDYLLLQFRFRMFPITKIFINTFINEYYNQSQMDYIWIRDYWLNFFNEKIKTNLKNKEKNHQKEKDPKKMAEADRTYDRIINMYERKKDEDVIKAKYGDLDCIKRCILQFYEKDIIALVL